MGLDVIVHHRKTVRVMSLSDYIAETKSSYRKLARRVGCSHNHLHNIARGIKGFDVDIALKIRAETGLSLDALAAPRARRLMGESGSAAAPDIKTKAPP